MTDAAELNSSATTPGQRPVPRRSPAQWWGLAAATVAAFVVIAPTLPRGYVLSYDMVFVPRQPLNSALLGLDGVVARAVPSDLVTALAARVLPADVVQSLVLLATLVVAGWGAARLLPDASRVAAIATAVLWVWNPFVYERLVIGQWSLLVGYAALPWVIRSALDMRGSWRPAAALWVSLAVAALGSPTGGLICLGAAVIVLATGGGVVPRAPRVGFALVAGLVVNLPWLLPSLLRPGGVPASSEGVSAFASRSDTPLGTLGSLLTLGGIWNAQVVPLGRDTWLAVPGLLLVLAVTAVGGVVLHQRRSPELRPLVLLGAVGVGLAVASSTPGLRGVVAAVVTSMPGGGLLRDAQKFVALLAPLACVGFGAGVAWLASRVGDRRVAALAGALGVLVPVIVLPALAWGASGRLAPVHYPRDWVTVQGLVARDQVPGAVVVLPWTYYRRYPWNDHRTVLTPAPRWLDRRVIVNDDLPLAGRSIAGEDPLARRLDPLVRSTSPLVAGLRAAGVRFVLVEHRSGSPEPAQSRLAGARRVHDGPDLTLYAVARPAPLDDPGPPVGPVVAGTVLAGLSTLAAIVLGFGIRGRRRC